MPLYGGGRRSNKYLVDHMLLRLGKWMRIMGRTRNKDKIELFLNGVEHISIGDLRKHCRKLNLSFKSVGRVIKEKVSNGTLKYGLDLDGKKFVMKKQ